MNAALQTLMAFLDGSGAGPRPAVRRGLWITGVCAAGIVLGTLSIANLTTYPATWFDEGGHLHVPKAIALFGAYADYSSDGLRFSGPTISLGPTVMLPVAAAFKVAGVGLLQARLVIVMYLLLAVWLTWKVGHRLGGAALGLLAAALIVTSRGVDLLFYGRQVLGEVPALALLLGAVYCWFGAMERPTGWRLTAAGALFGLVALTKYQFILFFAPALVLAWAANRFYYRVLPDRLFAWPIAAAALTFAAWQGVSILYIGLPLYLDNVRQIQGASAGAALVFSPDRMRAALYEVVTPAAYSSLLLPALLYSAVRARDRSLTSLRWFILLAIIGANLTWFVCMSIGWSRYAFCGLALGAFPVARLFIDLLSLRAGARSAWRPLVAVAILLTVGIPLKSALGRTLKPPADDVGATAAYLNQVVPLDVVVETWQPELGFLTDHCFHFPPFALQATAIASVWNNGRPTADAYDFRQPEPPAFVVDGAFSRMFKVYPEDRLATEYTLVRQFGPYRVYKRTAGQAVPTPCTAGVDLTRGGDRASRVNTLTLRK